MKIVPPYQTAISLFCIDGSVRVFASLSKAKKELGLSWIARNVGTYFRKFEYLSHFDTQTGRPLPVYSERNYIMRDDTGGVITHADFRTPYPNYYLRAWTQRYGSWNGEGPVPGVHKHNAGRHYYRHPSNLRSRKLALCVDDDEVAPRAKQSLRNLPDTWDDYGVASRRDRSWKRYRKTQYRESA